MPKKEKLRVKKAYWKYFENSPIVMKIINSRFWKRTPKAKDVCSCGNVGYKSLSKLTLKQANTILDLGQAITAMEKSRTREKDELVRIRPDVVERLYNQRDTITSLQQEVADLELIAKAREEVTDAK
jgi:hypothetical protein